MRRQPVDIEIALDEYLPPFPSLSDSSRYLSKCMIANDLLFIFIIDEWQVEGDG